MRVTASSAFSPASVSTTALRRNWTASPIICTPSRNARALTRRASGDRRARCNPVESVVDRRSGITYWQRDVCKQMGEKREQKQGRHRINWMRSYCPHIEIQPFRIDFDPVAQTDLTPDEPLQFLD